MLLILPARAGVALARCALRLQDCQMTARVSTNRANWQMRGKSSPQVGCSANHRAKPHVFTGFLR
jgi:hypothetical protein